MFGMWVFIAAVGLYTAIAAAMDLRTHRIPNYLTVPTALLGLAYHTLAPGGWGPLSSLAGFGLGFSLLLLPWLLGSGGMGDVKLLAALGAWLGPKLMLVAFATSALVAAVFILAILLNGAMTRGVLRTGRRYVAARRSRDKSGKRRTNRVLPFAVPVAVSTWAMLAWLITRGGM